MMKIAILGFGREGKSALRFFKKQPAYKKAEFWVLDENPAIKIPRGIHAQLGKRWLSDLGQFDLAVRSPGIYYHRPEFKAARRAGVKFTSATKLFFDCAAGKTRNIIGITGSKGKSTTATLLYKIMKRAGFSVFFAGNIGTSALDILPRLKKNSWVVLELSSFQLQDLMASPHIAVITDMFPEHQDIHDTIEDYYRAKTPMTRYQSAKDSVFYLDGNKTTKKIAMSGKGIKIAVAPDKFSLFAPKDIKLNGAHQYRNAALAATVALGLGVPVKVVKKTCVSFPGLPHRVEFVRSLGAVSFYNDSQSTNAYSVIAAAKSFPDKNVILIGGGYDKNVDYSPFKKSLKNSTLKLAVLFGQNKYKIQKAYRAAGIPTKIVPDLASAVRATYDFAQFSIPNPQSSAIILSPGTSSFDMFKNYTDRGLQFKKIVHTIECFRYTHMAD